MNRKGFTLIELVVTILILALVMTLGTYSVINVIKTSKEENLKLLRKNIKSAADNYYIECKYSFDSVKEMFTTETEASTFCNRGISNDYHAADDGITLGELVQYGYLSSNNKDKILVNPNTDEKIADCRIKCWYAGGKIIFANKSAGTGECEGVMVGINADE